MDKMEYISNCLEEIRQRLEIHNVPEKDSYAIRTIVLRAVDCALSD